MQGVACFLFFWIDLVDKCTSSVGKVCRSDRLVRQNVKIKSRCQVYYRVKSVAIPIPS